jgi:uncharacterized protein HemX
MAEIDQNEIDKLRKLGATVQLDDGGEGVRLTAQFRGTPESRDRQAWKSTLEEWERHLSDKMKPFGGHMVDGSLSLSGQTVELVVPVKDLEAAVRKLSDDDIGVRLTQERTIDPNF